MSDIDDEFEDIKDKNDNDDIENQSDVNSKDTYNDDDYYNDNIKEYKNAEYMPKLDPPKEISYFTKKPYDQKSRTTKETFMNFDEKFQKIKNEDYNEDEFPITNPEDIFENYQITFNENVDYSSTNYDNFSKNHLRKTLIEQIKKIDWINQGIRINEAKKETNAYESIYEKYFDRNQSCQLANINYLFEKKLIEFDNFYEGIPVFIVGDNGGFTDWIMYYTIEKMDYFPTIFVIPEKKNDFSKAKFRNQIKDKINDHVEILNDFYQEGRDLDENTNLSNDFIDKLAKTINDKTNGYKVNLFIARKVIKFSPDSAQEIKYKKFLLVNTLLAFKVLNTDGNFIIKLYDTFTPFTIGLIYMIFKNFKNVSIFKPVSTRQYSPCRFLVAENYLKNREEETNSSIKYLETFLTKYIEFTKNNDDVKLFLPSAELKKNDQFLKIIPEINNEITEKRIDALKEIIKYLDKKNTNLYDKMSIKKFFLDNWGVPVINFADPKQLKKSGDRYNNYQKKQYTEEEIAQACENIGNFDEDQKKMLMQMEQSNKRHKIKPKVKEKTPIKVQTFDDLKDKYDRLLDKFNKKPVKRPRKENDTKKNDSNQGGKKIKKDEKYEDNKDIKGKQFLNKKTERSDKKDEKKNLKKKSENKESKNDKKNYTNDKRSKERKEKKEKEKKEEKEEKDDNDNDNDNDLDLDEEFSKLDDELDEKINKLEKIKKKNK